MPFSITYCLNGSRMFQNLTCPRDFLLGYTFYMSHGGFQIFIIVCEKIYMVQTSIFLSNWCIIKKLKKLLINKNVKLRTSKRNCVQSWYNLAKVDSKVFELWIVFWGFQNKKFKIKYDTWKVAPMFMWTWTNYSLFAYIKVAFRTWTA